MSNRIASRRSSKLAALAAAPTAAAAFTDCRHQDEWLAAAERTDHPS